MRWRWLSWFWLGLGLAVTASAEEAWERLEPVPSRFPVFRDRLGYGWPLTGAGSWYSTGGNVFDAALQLTIHGERFVVERVERRNGRYAFTGRCGADWAVRREVWVDAERAAAFHLEEVHNASAASRDVVLELTTHVRTAWRSWSAGKGEAWVASALQPTTGAFLNFVPREGDSDLVFLLGDGDGNGAAVRPEIEARDQTFTVRYAARLTPGASFRILHALGQRRPGPGEQGEMGSFGSGWAEGRLRVPGVSGSLANFAEAPEEVAEGPVWRLAGGRELVLRARCEESIELTGALGRLRFSGEEIVRFDGRRWWTRDGFQFSAVAVPGQEVTVVTGDGEISVRLEEVREIRVPGEWPVAANGLRLRNGDVWPGRVASAEVEHVLRWEVQGVIREVPRDWVKE